MNLRNFVPDSSTINSMQVEEVAGLMLRLLSRQYNEACARAGAHAPERFHVGNFCNTENAIYVQNGQPPCLQALAEGWNHLVSTGMLVPDPQSQGAWHLLSRTALSVQTDDDYERFRKAALYPRGALHPTIEGETYAEFLRGDYETAVFKAFKAIEVAVRGHACLPDDLVGRALVSKAFNENGELTDPNEVKAEQESLLQLFSGAIGRFKNPASHREINITDPAEAIEIIQFASILMRIVDRRAASKREE